MGLSRDTFYRDQSAVVSGGVPALFDLNRRKPNLKNCIDEATSDRARAHAVEQLTHGQVCASNELRKAGVFVFPSGECSIWLRHDPACFKQCLSALEMHVVAADPMLTETQVIALEMNAVDYMAHGEIERAYPGYLSSQDTVYVGTLKGLGLDLIY